MKYTLANWGETIVTDYAESILMDEVEDARVALEAAQRRLADASEVLARHRAAAWAQAPLD